MPHRHLFFSAEDRAAAEVMPSGNDGSNDWILTPVETSNNGALLSDQLAVLTGEHTLLITSHFVHNVNCVCGLFETLPQQAGLTFILHESAAAILTPAGRAEYIAAWEDRYIDLRRDLGAYHGAEREAFQQYLDRVREASIELATLLEVVAERSPVNYEDLLAHRKTQQATEQIDPEERIDAAWHLHDSGQQSAGIEALQRAIELFPDQPELAYHRAIMLALTPGGVAQAREAVDRLLEGEPVYADALMLSGELYVEANQPALARQDWTRLADVHPRHPQVNQRLAELLKAHYPEVIPEIRQTYRRALRDNVGPDFLYGYADWLVGQRKEKKAKKILKRLLRQAPNYAAARYRLAVLAHADGRPESSAKHFARAVAIDADYDTPTNRLAFGIEAETTAGEVPAAEQVATTAPSEEVVETNLPSTPTSERTVLISGASSGIGLATARRLAAAGGYRLIILGRRIERLTELQQELLEQHQTVCYPLQLDVADRQAVAALMEILPEAWRSIDLLINNAGKAKGFDPIYRGDPDHWEEMIDVNLKGLLYLTRAVTPGMVDRERGMVINVCSTAGKEVYPNGNVYCATKHAVDALTYAMRLDLVKHGVRVGQICPAHVEETEFAVVRFDGDRERAKIYEDFQPLRSSDVAEAIYFMLSQPRHVNIMDMVLQGAQQASSTVVDRSGRERFAPNNM